MKTDSEVKKEGKAADRHLLQEISTVLNSNWSIPKDQVKATVSNGHVTLTGAVPWLYQKFTAQAFVGYLTGVKDVENNIIVKSELHNTVEQRRIEQSLGRNWAIKAKDIIVKVDGTAVLLLGIVASLYQKRQAEHIVARTPGIGSIDNRLIVKPKP